MKPITDKRYFDDVDLRDLEETQRQITLRIKKIMTTDPKRLENLAEELKYWTKKILYEKAKHLWRNEQVCNSKFEKIKSVLES